MGMIATKARMESIKAFGQSQSQSSSSLFTSVISGSQPSFMNCTQPTAVSTTRNTVTKTTKSHFAWKEQSSHSMTGFEASMTVGYSKHMSESTTRSEVTTNSMHASSASLFAALSRKTTHAK
jgi:hypothetical protein